VLVITTCPIFILEGLIFIILENVSRIIKINPSKNKNRTGDYKEQNILQGDKDQPL
jgi:hypothetical protein